MKFRGTPNQEVKLTKESNEPTNEEEQKDILQRETAPSYSGMPERRGNVQGIGEANSPI